VIAIALSIPTPTLFQDGAAAPQLVAEKKIDLVCGPVLLPDGTPIPPSQQTASTFILYRTDGAGVVSTWDDSVQQWTGGTSVQAQPLYPLPVRKAPGPGYWAATLVPIGQKDKSTNQDKFGSVKSTGLPAYYVICSFTYSDASGQLFSGTSLPSAPVAVLAPGANTSASVDVEPQPPNQAQSITLFLKDAAGGDFGHMAFSLQPPYAELSAVGATIRIVLGGDVVITPAAGRSVLVKGPLDASGGLYVNGVQVT
jgi:hypothetical protein